MTRPIKENEQWKLDGECQKCSRLNYCNKPCTISKRRTDAEIKQAIVRKMLNILGKRKI